MNTFVVVKGAQQKNNYIDDPINRGGLRGVIFQIGKDRIAGNFIVTKTR